MTVVGAGDVEPVRVRELRGIPVGRADRGDHEGAFRDRLAAHLHLRVRDAGGPLHRAVVAQQLLHRAADERGLPMEAFELGGMPEQGKEAVADQVHGGLVAGDEEQDAGGEQLALGEPVALLLHCDEGGEQVRARMAAALGEQRAEVVRDPAPADAPALHDRRVGRDADRVEAPDDVRRPLLDLLVVADRHPQHVADDGHGKGIGEIGDHVHPPRRLHPVEQAVDHALDLAAHALDHPGGERPVDERPQAGVVGRVAEEHGAGEAAGLRLLAVLGREDGLEAVAAEARVPQRRDAVLVAGQDPEAERAQVDGVGLAQVPVERVGVGVEGGRERVEEVGLRHVTQLTIA